MILIRPAPWLSRLSLSLLSLSSSLLLNAAALGAPAASPGSPTPDGSTTDSAKALARARAKAQVHKGQLDYKLGHFDQALEDYGYAYELYPAPALLFNLGQCHRNLQSYERAIFFFEGYLHEEPKISPDQRALTEELIAECKTALDRQRATRTESAARPAVRPVAPPIVPARAAVPAPAPSGPPRR